MVDCSDCDGTGQTYERCETCDGGGVFNLGGNKYALKIADFLVRHNWLRLPKCYDCEGTGEKETDCDTFIHPWRIRWEYPLIDEEGAKKFVR